MQGSIRVSSKTSDLHASLVKKTGKTKAALILGAVDEKYTPKRNDHNSFANWPIGCGYTEPNFLSLGLRNDRLNFYVKPYQLLPQTRMDLHGHLKSNSKPTPQYCYKNLINLDPQAPT